MVHHVLDLFEHVTTTEKKQANGMELDSTKDVQTNSSKNDVLLSSG